MIKDKYREEKNEDVYSDNSSGSYSDEYVKWLESKIDLLQFELKAADSVNAQLQSKVDELEKANNQLKLDLKASENNAKNWLV